MFVSFRLALALAAATATAAQAHVCGTQRDLLVRADPLLATVRPADCATVLHQAPAFAWPGEPGRNTYVVDLTFPDGHVESRATGINALAWDRPLPAGRYLWSVRRAGDIEGRSELRSFVLDERAAH